MEAIVLAGGFGTRLSGIVKEVPKPMAPVAGKPFLEYIIQYLNTQGVRKVILAVGYKKDCIKDYFKDSYLGVDIAYSDEDTPLYTGGAVKQAMQMVASNEVVIINGDTFFNVDLKLMAESFHQDACEIEIAVKPMENFSRFGEVLLDKSRIVEMREKEFCGKGYINGGVYIMSRNIFDDYKPKAFSMETDFFPLQISKGKVFAYSSDGFFIDIGIPEDYSLAQTLFGGEKIV